MHLHIWTSSNRKKGLGLPLLRMSIARFFEELELQQLICEPYAMNAAPNAILEKAGFRMEKEYLTIPGSMNFEQQVCRWVMERPADLYT